MNTQDMCSAFVIRQTKLDAPVETTRSEQGRIQRIGSVGGHQHLDITSWVETIKLVDELKHRSLHLVITSGTVVKSSTSNGIDLIEEDDARLLRPRHLEKLSNHPRALSYVFLDQLRTNDSNEGGVCAVSNSTGAQCLSRSRRSVEKDTLRRVDTQIDKLLGLYVRIGQIRRNVSAEKK